MGKYQCLVDTPETVQISAGNDFGMSNKDTRFRQSQAFWDLFDYWSYRWNLLPFWLPIPRQWLLQSHKAELPVLPRWRHQWDVLPQRIAVQGQRLLPSALSRAEIHLQQRRGEGRHNYRFPCKTHES